MRRSEANDDVQLMNEAIRERVEIEGEVAAVERGCDGRARRRREEVSPNR